MTDNANPADLAAQGLPVNYGSEPWRPEAGNIVPMTEQEFLGNAKPGWIDLHHPNGTPKTVDEIQQEAADLNAIDEYHADTQISVKDWNGHTPADHEAVIDGNTGTVRFVEIWQAAAERDLTEHKAAHIADGLRALVMESGENSRDHGFHDDWPVDVDLISPGKDRDYQKAIVEKLALVHEEVSESLGEIRSGHDPLETYFVRKDDKAVFREQAYDENGTPLLKPEGFLVELADAVIRIADLVYLVGGREEFIKARAIKHEYNASREYKHGRKF